MDMNRVSTRPSRIRAIVLPAIAPALAIGLVETSVAATCASDSTLTLDTGGVTIDDMDALDCGYGSTNNDFVTPPPSNWQINQDNAGNLGVDWTAYYKQEINEDDGTTTPESGAGGWRRPAADRFRH